MMNLKSFLVRNFSRILYFLARKNSGKGSVPHSICKVIILFSGSGIVARKHRLLWTDDGLSTLVQSFVFSETTNHRWMSPQVMVWFGFISHHCSREGASFSFPVRILPPTTCHRACQYGGGTAVQYVRISLWVKIGNCGNNRLIYIFLYIVWLPMQTLQRSWVQSQHPSTSSILVAADEAVLNKVLLKKSFYICFHNSSFFLSIVYINLTLKTTTDMKEKLYFCLPD